MKKIFFIADFFSNEISGGAEIYDQVLIEQLRSRGTKVCKFKSQEFTEKHFHLYLECGFNFIISNFVALPEKLRKLFTLYGDRYCILEHDHKYLRTRNPSVFTDYKAPPEFIINREFYKSAKQIFCQSSKHAEVLSNNLKIDNVTNLGCSLWSKEQLDIIRNSIFGNTSWLAMYCLINFLSIIVFSNVVRVVSSSGWSILIIPIIGFFKTFTKSNAWGKPVSIQAVSVGNPELISSGLCKVMSDF